MAETQNETEAKPTYLLRSGAVPHKLTREDALKSVAVRRAKREAAKAQKLADLAPKAYTVLGRALDQGMQAEEVNGHHLRAAERVIDQVEPKTQSLQVDVNPLEMDAGAFLAHVEGMLKRRQLEDGNTVDGEAQELPSDDPPIV